MLRGTSVAVLEEMVKDMKHPSLYERAVESSIDSKATAVIKDDHSDPIQRPLVHRITPAHIGLQSHPTLESALAVKSSRPANPLSISSSRLPGVKASSWAGISAAAKAGAHGATRIPGVKEATWPFAAGSFAGHHSVARMPGVNEDSWWIFEPGSSWRADRARATAAAAGGCRVGPGGRLACDGDAGAQTALETAVDRATGLGDVQARATLLRDANLQGLTGAAAVFGASMRSVAPARVQMLAAAPSAASRRARTQELEIVGGQCSTLLDCFRLKSGRLVPHRTLPAVAAEWDREVRRPEDSANLWEIASGAAHHASDAAGGWDRRSSLLGPGYTGRIGRPARVHFVSLLPKTRSGKLLRRSMQALAEGRDPGDLTTLDDPSALDQVRAALRGER